MNHTFYIWAISTLTTIVIIMITIWGIAEITSPELHTKTIETTKELIK